jgi:uncharacterized protein with beta-barrel porin domain
MKKNRVSFLVSSLLLSGAFSFANAASINYHTSSNQFDVYVYADLNRLSPMNIPFSGVVSFSGEAINVLVDSTADNLKYVGSSFKILISDSITVNNLTIKDNSALLDFEYFLYNGTIKDDLSLIAIQAQTISQSVNTLSSDNKNAGNAARVLQKLYDTNSDVQGALNKLGTDKDVARAVDSTTPQRTTSSFTAATQISNNVSNIISQRQNVNLNGTGLNSGDDMINEKNVWIKTYGSYGEQNNKDNINGFDIKTYGLGFGVDGEYATNQKIGLGFFYTNADVDVNNVSQKSDIDVYSLIVYGNVPVIDDKTNFLYQVGYSWQKTDTNRDIEFVNQTAKADYTSKIASVDLKLVRDFRVNEEILLQPYVSTLYRHFETPSYTETGADALNLNVNKFSSSEFVVGLGTMGYYKIDEESRLTGSVGLGYDLRDDNNIVSSSYQGASGLSFDTEGIDNGRWSYDVGVGYENDLSKLSNVSLNYNLQGQGEDYLNHVVSLKYTYKF